MKGNAIERMGQLPRSQVREASEVLKTRHASLARELVRRDAQIARHLGDLELRGCG